MIVHVVVLLFLLVALDGLVNVHNELVGAQKADRAQHQKGRIRNLEDHQA